jgi:DNA-binding response OmpR family regulator
MKNNKILYVEDDHDIAEAVKILLNKQGFDVHLAHTGKDGMKIGLENEFDLILLDYMLPDITGWDIFESLRLKKQSKFAFLTIIPTTNERLDLMKAQGLSDYIQKPFNKNELVNRIKNILKGGQ